MSKDTGELIIMKKSINLCCQPIISYILSLVIVRNFPFSQSLSHNELFSHNVRIHNATILGDASIQVDSINKQTIQAGLLIS